MKLNNFSIGETIEDILTGDKSIIRSMDKGIFTLSRIEKPESYYYNIVNFLKKI